MLGRSVIHRPKGVQALERLCSTLFSGEQGEHSCLVHKVLSCPSQQFELFRVGLSFGAEVGLAIERPTSRMERSETIVTVARNLARLGRSSDACWIAPPVSRKVEDCEEYEALLTDPEQTQKRIRIRLNAEVLSKLAPPLCHAGVVNRPLCIELPLRIFLRSVPSRGDAQKTIKVESPEWRLGVLGPTGDVIRVEFVGEEKIGVRMTNEKLLSPEFPVQIELGTIALPAETIVELRPGDEISVGGAIPMVGTLRIGREPWARVQIEHQDSGLLLRVEALLGVEETFPEKSRLTS
ncbi:MAG: hypothetical protein EBZ48_06530 [Proteobacteria bacterium]|nr:hypothetical protein [Pseudomonadota bacterium]